MEKRNGKAEWKSGMEKRNRKTAWRSGKIKEKIEIAKKMKKSGIDIDTIHEMTELSKEEIENL